MILIALEGWLEGTTKNVLMENLNWHICACI